MNAAADHQGFLERVVESGTVWGLKDSSGWAITESDAAADCLVVLFWSDREGAGRCAKQEWASFAPASIDLPSFLAKVLPTLARDRHLAGIDWDGDLRGAEAEPQALRAALEERLGTT